MLHLNRGTGQFADRAVPRLPRPSAARRPARVQQHPRLSRRASTAGRSGSKAQPLSPQNPASRDFLRGRVEVLLDPAAQRRAQRMGVPGPARPQDRRRRASFLRRSTTNCRRKSSPGALSASAASASLRSPISLPRVETHRPRSAAALHRPRRPSRRPRALPDRLRPRTRLGGRAHRRPALHPGNSRPPARPRHRNRRSHAARRTGNVSARARQSGSKITSCIASPIPFPRSGRSRSIAPCDAGSPRRGRRHHHCPHPGIRRPASRRADRGRAPAKPTSSSIPATNFSVVGALLTNFHLPQSTLLMLVCAFGGQRTRARRLPPCRAAEATASIPTAIACLWNETRIAIASFARDSPSEYTVALQECAMGSASCSKARLHSGFCQPSCENSPQPPSTTPTEIVAFLQNTRSTPDTLAPYLTWDRQHYTRNLIDKTPLYELVAICWEVGQASSVHNHRDQNCWMAVPIGRLRVENYRVDFSRSKKARCELETADTVEMNPRHPCAVDPLEPVHRVLQSPRIQPARREPARVLAPVRYLRGVFAGAGHLRRDQTALQTEYGKPGTNPETQDPET